MEDEDWDVSHGDEVYDGVVDFRDETFSHDEVIGHQAGLYGHHEVITHV